MTGYPPYPATDRVPDSHAGSGRDIGEREWEFSTSIAGNTNNWSKLARYRHVRSLIVKMHATELEDWGTFGKIRQAEEKRLRVNQTFCSGKDHARRSDLALRRRFIGWPVLPAKGDAATEISHSRTTHAFSCSTEKRKVSYLIRRYLYVASKGVELVTSLRLRWIRQPKMYVGALNVDSYQHPKGCTFLPGILVA